MAITLRSAGTVGENTVAAGTTLLLPYPTGMAAGDLMVLSATTNSTTPPTLPAGWTQIFRASANSGANVPGELVCIKYATGSESGNFSLTVPNIRCAGQIIAFAGVDQTTPQDVAATSVDSAASLTRIIPTLTTTMPGVALVYAADHATVSVTATPPSSPAAFTETSDGTTQTHTMGYLIWSGSGATGSVTVTFSATSSRGIGVLLALRPAAVASSNFLMFA